MQLITLALKAMPRTQIKRFSKEALILQKGDEYTGCSATTQSIAQIARAPNQHDGFLLC